MHKLKCLSVLLLLSILLAACAPKAKLATEVVETEAPVDVTEERARMKKELSEAQSQIARLEKLISSPFAEKAPPPVVAKEREKLAGN